MNKEKIVINPNNMNQKELIDWALENAKLSTMTKGILLGIMILILIMFGFLVF